MINGWIVGDFDPTCFKTNACEVAVKNYKSGETEAEHYHKIATELTMVVSGKVRMMNETWSAGDIIIVEPGEKTSFEALTDVTNVVVKLPGVLNDKYID